MKDEPKVDLRTPEECVLIPESEYRQPLRDRDILQTLEMAGVDNWEGYEMAMNDVE